MSSSSCDDDGCSAFLCFSLGGVGQLIGNLQRVFPSGLAIPVRLTPRVGTAAKASTRSGGVRDVLTATSSGTIAAESDCGLLIGAGTALDVARHK